ncbi:MAG: histidine phosphatase family protein [Saprospiraceae bacterium]|nr:histidine phosphatase family protein [Saprospiraceae bacterium]
MKTIYLIRHAKSDWNNPSIRDIDRPLNSRGQRDAPFMAKMLAGRGAAPDKLVSSPANRALTTASYFAAELGIPLDQILENKTIYEASPTSLLREISHLDEQWNCVLLFGHNPTFTDVANRFSNQYIPNMPTCGVCKIESSATQWAEMDPINSQLTEFHFPKQYFPA